MRPATALLGLIALLLPPPAAALPLTVAVILVPGFVDKVELPNSEPAYTGLAIQVFHAALDTICKTGPECWSKDELKYIEAENEGDNNTATGVWTGVLGLLQRGEADVGVGDINELLIRTRVVSFSGSWLEAPLAFLALPVTPPRSSYLWGWLRPFTPAVWLCLLALTALFAVSLAWLERWSPFSYRNLPPPRGREELRQRVNMKDTTHRAVNSLLGQGPWGIDLSSHSARVIWWAMAFNSLFVTTTYTSSLTSQLVAAPPSVPISSIADIQIEEIPFCVQADSSAYNFFTNALNSIAIRKMAAYMVTAPTLPLCLDKLLDPADPVRVVAAEAPVLSILSGSPPYCGPVLVGTLTGQGYYSFPVRQGHPILQPLTDAVLSNMENLVTSDLISAASGGGCRGSGAGGDAGGSAVGVDDLGGVFFATLILVAFSWMLLGCEVVVWRRRESHGRWARACFKFCGGHYFVDAYDAEDAEVEAAYVVASPKAKASKGREGAGEMAVVTRTASGFAEKNPLGVNW